MSRTIQHKVNGEWLDINWPDVKTGMTVRMFEVGGVPIDMLVPGRYEAVTVKDSYMGPNEIWEISIE